MFCGRATNKDNNISFSVIHREFVRHEGQKRGRRGHFSPHPSFPRRPSGFRKGLRNCVSNFAGNGFEPCCKYTPRFDFREKHRRTGGRRCAPPTKWLVKNLKVKLWSIFMTSLELILSKISKKNNCPPPPAGGTGRKTRRLAGKKWRGFRGGNFLPVCLY